MHGLRMQIRDFTSVLPYLAFLVCLLALPVSCGVVKAANQTEEPAAVDTADIASEITITDGTITIRGKIGDAARKLGRLGRTGRIRIRGDSDDDGGFLISTDAEDIEGIVQVGRRLLIDADEKVVGDVVCIGGPIVIRGEVQGDAVSLGGDIRVEGDGLINGDALSIGGYVSKQRIARIRGETASLGLLPGLQSHPGFFTWFGLTHIKLGLEIGKIILVLVFCWLVIAAVPARIARISQAIERSFLLSLLIGFLVLVASLPLMLLFVISIVGIPLAVLYPILLLLACFVGYTAGVVTIGRRIGSTASGGLRSAAGAALVGILIIEGLGLLGMLLGLSGGIVWPLGTLLVVAGAALGGVVTMVGLGSQVLTRFGSREYPASL